MVFLADAARRRPPQGTTRTSASDLGDHLRARRALVRPEQVGLEPDAQRRVDGLRRQEVAQLAGISPEYYLRLEQGRGGRPSGQVLAALARALLLDRHATEYLLRLGREAPEAGGDDRRPDTELLGLLASWSEAPSVVLNGTQDVMAANAAGRLISGGLFAPGGNVLLRLYDRGAEAVGPSWGALVETHAAAMRFHASPGDPGLHEVVGELSLRHAHFRRTWARHDARPNISGRVVTAMEPIGEFELAYQCLDLPGHPGCTLSAFYASPESDAGPALAFLMAQVP